jgi:hypothetical protein
MEIKTDIHNVTSHPRKGEEQEKRQMGIKKHGTNNI